MRNLFISSLILTLIFSCDPLSNEKHIFVFNNQEKETIITPPKSSYKFEIILKKIRDKNDKIIVYRYYNNIKGNGDIYEFRHTGLLISGDIYDNKLGIKYLPHDKTNSEKSNILEIIFSTNTLGFDKTIKER